MAARAPSYSDRKGWTGGDSRTLYAITDRRTMRVTVLPGGGMVGVGPEADIRVATRAEAEEHWQSPLHSGWRVAADNPPRVYRAQKVVGKLDKDPRPALKPGSIVSSPRDLAMYTLADYADRAEEVFVIVYIDVRNRVVGYNEYASGSTSGVEVHVSGILRDALVSGAAAFLTAHQHPTGDPTPSDDDRQLWKRIRAAGELVGIPCMDNLVIGEGGKYFSESEERR